MDKLLVLEGNGKGTTYQLHEALVTIGRGPECTIRLPETDVRRPRRG